MPSSMCLCNVNRYAHTEHNTYGKFNKQKRLSDGERERERENKTATTKNTSTHHAHIIFGPVFARHEIKFYRLAECSSRDNTHSAYHNEKPKITLKYYCTRATAAAAAASTESASAPALAPAPNTTCTL